MIDASVRQARRATTLQNYIKCPITTYSQSSGKYHQIKPPIGQAKSSPTCVSSICSPLHLAAWCWPMSATRPPYASFTPNKSYIADQGGRPSFMALTATNFRFSAASVLTFEETSMGTTSPVWPWLTVYQAHLPRALCPRWRVL